MKPKRIFTGIADAHGIESFQPCEEIGKGSSLHGFRVRANRHRHALIYWVELNDAQVEVISKLLGDEKNDERFMDACRLLHNPDFVEVEMVENEMRRSWDMLPDRKLDPYWSGDDE